MENLIDTQHGSSVLLASLVIVLCLFLILKVVEMALKESRQNKTNVEEELKKLISTLQENNYRLARVESDLATLPKMKIDMRRVFNVIKYMAGDNWAKYREIMDDDFDT